MKIPRIVFAGTTSGVGKTSITCAVIHGFRKKGYSVQPFKVGPDYIDPSYLSTVSGKETHNLDFWLMGKTQLVENFVNYSKSDISVIEGVMGYFDGYDGKSNIASTHHIAELTKSPVILIIDASKAARSVAATALGFVKFHKNSRICGVILNKLGSQKHEKLCRDAFKKIKLPVLGTIPKNPDLALESRHLGLIPTTENIKLDKKIRKISEQILDYVDLEKIISFTKNLPAFSIPKKHKVLKNKITIGVALDNSFNFYYKDNLESLKRQGAKLKFFSPVNSKKLSNLDGIYIGGGFPEVLGKNLEKNVAMRKKIKKLAEAGTPIYAECGGLMYLTKSINYKNKSFKMVGIFDAETVMTKKMILNYTKGRIMKNSIISSKPINFHGHEFHYSKLVNISSDSQFVYHIAQGNGITKGKDGLTEYDVLASYGHLYFGDTDIAKNFVKNCILNSRR